MSDQNSSGGMKSRGLLKFGTIFGAILVCGVIGYFIAGSDGRALGGGIGAFLGLVIAGVIAKQRG